MQMIALSMSMVIVCCNCGAEYVFVIRLLLSDTSTHHWTSSHDQYKLFHSPFIIRPDTLPPSLCLDCDSCERSALATRHKSDKLICKRQNIKSPLLLREHHLVPSPLRVMRPSNMRPDSLWSRDTLVRGQSSSSHISCGEADCHQLQGEDLIVYQRWMLTLVGLGSSGARGQHWLCPSTVAAPSRQPPSVSLVPSVRASAGS